MKAIIQEKYGSSKVLKLREVAKPILGEDQVLVKINAASVNFGNLVLLRGKPFLARLAFGLTKPKYSIPGGDLSGIVEAVGKKVTQFQLGDEVFADLSGSGWGAFAEHVAVSEEVLVKKPTNLSFEEAAAVPMAAVTALQALRMRGKLLSGQSVLIYGASGGVGTFAVQIAKALGAKVTAVCSTRNVKIVTSLGADTVIDYKKEDFSEREEKYHLILGVNGHQAISTYKNALHPSGQFIHVGGSGAQMFQTIVVGPFSREKKVSSFLQRANQKDLKFVKELIEAGKVRPVIDRTFTLNEVTEAMTYFEGGHPRGKVVITMK